MEFALPQALLLFLLVPAVVGHLWLTFRWKDRMLGLFAKGPGASVLIGSVSRFRQLEKAALVVMALATIALGSAGPYVGGRPQPRRVSPADVLVVLDVSLSMAAQDVQPSRLGLAKREVFGLLDRLERSRVGLVVFGGSAALRFPLTIDYDAARVLARAVEVDSAPTPGTALGEGIRTAIAGLRQSKAPVRVILLLSDGENFGAPLEEALQAAAEEGIPVHVVGLGTTQGGPIPVADPLGSETILKRDREGQIVVTRLNEASLQLLAESTDGSYQRATPGGRDLQRIFERVTLQGHEPVALAAPNDLTPYFALLAFLLLLVELLIPERRSRRPVPAPALMLLPLVLLATVACVRESDDASELNQLGSQLYDRSQFSEALDAFQQAQIQRPDLPELNLNAGDALYKTEEFERALRETQRALSDERSDLRASAHFNMGNAYFQVKRFQDAFEEYKRALRESPQDMDAKINLELALSRLMMQEKSQADQGGNGDRQEEGDQQEGGDQQEEGDQQPQDNNTQQDREASQQDDRSENAALKLQRALREAGSELTIEEVLRILDALREREQELQGKYNVQAPKRATTFRPEQDW